MQWAVLMAVICTVFSILLWETVNFLHTSRCLMLQNAFEVIKGLILVIKK